ncbi:unnamed protein product [Acanthoscelides obtectus]|uniref:Uncharacterized protein n=1 Tax=Acanthoscelides obtectus TaxID=200917 RepID=A0A9P0JU21_ACAOB|nr:unnamed protein product [Acanthoscelides obtectus]CAK1668949.1 hypothetical protein AOBTE_LOCUS26703 [Acanthoscelides obtectus]
MTQRSYTLVDEMTNRVTKPTNRSYNDGLKNLYMGDMPTRLAKKTLTRKRKTIGLPQAKCSLRLRDSL